MLSSNSLPIVIFIRHIFLSYRARKVITYFSMDRERTADMVSSMHPNSPVSNCVKKDRLEKKRLAIFQTCDRQKLEV